MKKILGYFLKGLFFILPLLLIISILRGAFSLILLPNAGWQINLGIILGSIVFVTLVGFLISRGAKFYFRNKKLKAFSKFPFFGQITASVKKFFLILNFSREIFEKPVMIKREQGKEIKFGFVTNGDLKEFGLENHSSVYLPNPFSFLGEMVIVENKYLEPIKSQGPEVSNFILSGGLMKK